jgi:ribonucleoside-diphosphate reductase beta chain
LILTILEENPEIATPEFAAEIKNIIIEGVRLENAYNQDLFPRGILGINADYVNQYVRYIADRRLEELGFEPYFNDVNPAQWMATETDTLELVNFFEAQNTKYEVDNRAHNS